jgi:alpha-L-fucosidase
MEFGIIIHWGVYSVPAYDSIESAKRRSMQNGAEWYLKRLYETNTFRPVAGHTYTKEFHKKKYGEIKYEKFADMFTCENWVPEEWMRMCVKMGATYIILTSKHHDGYCLWDTKTTHFNSMKTGPKRDIIGEFVESARSYGLKVGIYYSWWEFNQSITINFVKNTIKPQLEELMKYNPDIFWFDGSWEIKSAYAKTFCEKVCKEMRSKGIVINDRIGGDGFDYKTFEKKMPITVETNWEYTDTIGLSWGINNDQKESDYKTIEEIYALREKAKELGATRFLLNIGPDADGNFDINEQKILEQYKH